MTHRRTLRDIGPGRGGGAASSDGKGRALGSLAAGDTKSRQHSVYYRRVQPQRRRIDAEVEEECRKRKREARSDYAPREWGRGEWASFSGVLGKKGRLAQMESVSQSESDASRAEKKGLQLAMQAMQQLGEPKIGGGSDMLGMR